MKKFLLGFMSLFMFISMITWQNPVKAVEGGSIQTTSVGNLQAVASGESSFFVDESSVLWAWGGNTYGQLGDGTTQKRLRPIRIMENVVSVSSTYYHTVAIKTDGSLWAWGSNIYGQLGSGTNVNSLIPIKIMENVKSVSAGGSHTLAVKTDGSLWAWGNNDYGQLGNGTTNGRLVAAKVMENVASVSAGSAHSLAIRIDGTLLGWGSNGNCQLGLVSSTCQNRLSPAAINVSVTFASAGSSHNQAIKTDRSLWAIGWNSYGQLGDGTYDYKYSFKQVMGNTESVSAGSTHTLAVQTDNSLWAWGNNRQGQILIDIYKYLQYPSPVRVMENVASASAGGQHSLAIKTDGSLLAWGWNMYGQIGNGEEGGIAENPVLVIFDKIAPIVTGVSDGIYYNTNRTIGFNEGTATLNGVSITSETLVEDEGSYTLIVTDDARNSTTVHFVIDKTAPIITVDDYPILPINQDITVTVSVNEGTLNATSHTFTENGSFTFIATDLAGNTSEKVIIITNIDKNNPIVTGVSNDAIYNNDRTITFDKGSATLNGITFILGSTVSDDGSYVLIVTDAAGNSTTINFVIDKTAPIITVTPYSDEPTHLPVTVSVSTDEGTLNTSSYTFNENGSFTFIATDLAGNVTEKTVTITHIVSPTQVKTIVINQLPTKLQYIRGVELDPTGGQLTATTYEGTVSSVGLTPDMLSGYDPYSPAYGPQTVTVTYQGVATSFEVYLNRFIDVPYGHRNYTHINALVGLGIINGYSDNTFRPNNTLTRAQAAIMIARAAGLSTEGVSSSFTDVPSSHAAYKFISAAYQAGIINGYSDGSFRPNANVTRAQIAIMVQRAFNIQASGTVISFTDVSEGYAPKKFIEILASQKIVNGYSDGTFKPLNNVTRAQFSTMIYNAIQYAQKTE